MPSIKKVLTAPTARPAEGAFRQFIHTLGLIERVMHPYFAQFGISGAQWSVLRNLHRAEQEGHAGLRLTDLSERLLVRPPSVTGVVDRLEKVGLVARGGVPPWIPRCPAGRRGVRRGAAKSARAGDNACRPRT